MLGGWDGTNGRFRDLYMNSGIVYLKATRRIFGLIKDITLAGVVSIDRTHSHQEPFDFFLWWGATVYKDQLRVKILPEHQFINGHQIHHDRPLDKELKSQGVMAHMSWCDNYQVKVMKFFMSDTWEFTPQCSFYRKDLDPMEQGFHVDKPLCPPKDVEKLRVFYEMFNCQAQEG